MFLSGAERGRVVELSQKRMRKQLERIKPLLASCTIEVARKGQEALGLLLCRSYHKKVCVEKADFPGFPACRISPRNQTPSGRILYLHGGGYTCGGLEYAKGFGSVLASITGAEVLCPAYRLAPEHPFPAGLEDGLTAYKSLLEQEGPVVLCAHGIREYALSETQKYGHVTYFWNGNRSGKVDEHLETYEEIPSDVIPFEQAPAMKSAEITEHMVTAMASRQFDFLRCNFPNGDMVGHTGVLEAVITAMECVDQSLARILEAADQYGYTVLVTADHGNADQMTETKKGKTSIRTAHSLNPVPFIVYDKDHRYTLKDGSYGLANVAPTVAKLMDIPAPACWEDSMI